MDKHTADEALTLLETLEEIASRGLAVGLGTCRSGWACDVSDESDYVSLRSYGYGSALLAVTTMLEILDGNYRYKEGADVAPPCGTIDGKGVNHHDLSAAGPIWPRN